MLLLPFLGSTQLQLLANVVTVAILAQGTSWAVTVTQAFLLFSADVCMFRGSAKGKMDIDFT